MKPVKKVALLHDLCGVGKAAMTNMLPVLSVMGIEACPIPTMLLSTHTGGYGRPAIARISPEYIKGCADHYREQKVVFDMIFIGYLGNEELAESVLYFVSCFPEAMVVFDPIMGDHGKYYSNFDTRYGEALKKLIPCADLLLPNLTESCLLSGHPYTTELSRKDLGMICETLHEMGAKKLIVTSVPDGRNEKAMLLYEGGTLTVMETTQLSAEFHGTGDAFDGVLIASILKGCSLKESMAEAHRFVYACMVESLKRNYEEREGLMIEKNLYMLV